MNITDLLGAVMQSGMSPSSGNRMKNALGGGSLLESLAGKMGGQPLQGGGLGSILSQALGGGSGSGGLGGILGNVLNDAGNAVGGKQNLALGGLGALAGALLGGGGKSLGGALGGGIMALLGTMAYQALKGAGSQPPEVPLGLVEPQSEGERQELENGRHGLHPSRGPDAEGVHEGEDPDGGDGAGRRGPGRRGEPGEERARVADAGRGQQVAYLQLDRHLGDVIDVRGQLYHRVDGEEDGDQ